MLPNAGLMKESLVTQIKTTHTRTLVGAFPTDQREAIAKKIAEYADKLFVVKDGVTVVDDDALDAFDNYLHTEFDEYLKMYKEYLKIRELRKKKKTQPLTAEETKDLNASAETISKIYAKAEAGITLNKMGVNKTLDRMQAEGTPKEISKRMKAIEKDLAPLFADKQNHGDELRATFRAYKQKIIAQDGNCVEERNAFKKVYVEAEKNRMKALQNAVHKEEIANRMLTVEEGNAKLSKIMEDSAKGDSGQGLFFKNVMRKYFGGVSTLDKRAMFASAMRQAKPVVVNKKTDELEPNKQLEAAFLSGYLKGAGPLLQKMLQGVPESAVPPELRVAIRDMKSKLLPISQEFVEAQIASMVERSHGSITKIEVKRALGAASVGQAFLCTAYGPKMKKGKEIVIKILRPDVKNRMEREEKIMLEAARETNKGMEGTYKGQLERIREEMDLTIETHNVEIGRVYDKDFKDKNKKNHVKSMKTDKMVDSTSNSMVIEKAPGTTVDQYLEELREFRASIKRDYLERTPSGQLEFKKRHGLTINEYEDYEKLRAEMAQKLTQLRKRYSYMGELAFKWVEEGIFGTGFYHGDLHAGNIMITDDELTVIDFGNVTQLDKLQKDEITRMMMAAAAGDSNDFYEGYMKLLGTSDPEFVEKHKDELKSVVEKTFLLGNKESAGARIATVLMRAQEIGFLLPAAIYNFSQCQIRLQNAMDEMGKIETELLEDVSQLNLLPEQLKLDYNGAYTPSLIASYEASKVRSHLADRQVGLYKDAQFSVGYYDKDDVMNDLHKESEDDITDFKRRHLVDFASEADTILQRYKGVTELDSVKAANADQKANKIKEELKSINKQRFGPLLKRLAIYCPRGFADDIEARAEALFEERNVNAMEALIKEIKAQDITAKLYDDYCNVRKKKPAKDATDEDKAAYEQKVAEAEQKFWTEYNKLREDIPDRGNWFSREVRDEDFATRHVFRPMEKNGEAAMLTNHVESMAGGKYGSNLLEQYKKIRARVNSGERLDEKDPDVVEFKKYYDLRAYEQLGDMLNGQIDLMKAMDQTTHNFFGVMNGVITQHSGDAFMRVGFRKLKKYSAKM
ncbi:MAG: phosphotransferase [Lachnospiraceae bacterium]|nr:phosphotransferase [Lachnospiraceae bacterium]